MSKLSALGTRLAQYKSASFQKFRTVRKDERGVSLIEYGALLLLVAAIVAAVFSFGIDTEVEKIYEDGIDQVKVATGMCQGETCGENCVS